MKPIKLLTDKDVKKIVDKQTDKNMSFLDVEINEMKTDLLHISANLEIITLRLKALENKFLEKKK